MISRNKTKPLDRLTFVLQLFTRGLPPRDGLPFRHFGVDPESAISLVGEKIQLFETAIDEWLDVVQGTKGTLSRKTFVDKVIPLIQATIITGEQLTSTDVEQFEKALSDLPLYKFRVLRQIYGVVLSDDNNPVQMGDFTISHGQCIQGQIQTIPFLSGTWKPEDAKHSFIECVVEARDCDKAVELADVLFYRFELIMRVLIGRRTRSFEVGILNYVGPQIRDRIVVAIGGGPASQGGSWVGAVQPIPLNDPFFSNPPAPFAKLLQLISRKNNNEVEKHVLRCAEWTGQAMAEPNAASAFVKAAIALEVMFRANEKGVITPSIMAQIAESCAFLLGSSANPPLQVEGEVKRLYGIRSAVVHSGKDSVKQKDLKSLIDICCGIIRVLLSDEELTKLEKIDSLADYFKRKKYD